ncbi:hypothetical protein GQ55_5G056800 [Panicum hallii var. hallii]|uniref:Uncharacterized protein n=1 Tax=Panicum hallii var. hallii TaxID=1504633 RepID=A0A2T7DD83_9POAL|nr:hypothetical protein GQ55_5G056800 [Panicum hallii var. hallii]
MQTTPRLNDTSPPCPSSRNAEHARQRTELDTPAGTMVREHKWSLWRAPNFCNFSPSTQHRRDERARHRSILEAESNA